MSTIKRVGIVGSGQMGKGITQICAMQEYDVVLYNRRVESLDVAEQAIKSMLQRGVEKEKWDQDFVNQTMLHVTTTAEMKDLSDCDIVIEAIPEDASLKFAIFKDLDNTLKEDAIICSNTSSISITELGACTSREDKVIGLHFMNPAQVMKLVEIIKGLETADTTYEICKDFLESLNKVHISSNDVPGFTINRILIPMINEAVFALSESVASVEDIDKAMKLGTNQPMGPLELADFIGLDVCLAIMETLYAGLGDTKYRPCPLLKKYVQAKRLGRKVGKGFYSY